MNKIYQKIIPDGKNRPKSVLGGFTLMELLVVVLIIGILAAIALPRYSLAVRKAKAATVLATLNKMMEASDVYYMANGTYTTDMEALDATLANTDPYKITLQDEGFRWEANAQNKPGYPILQVFGTYRVPVYGHQRKWRLCIGGTDETAAVCKSLGGIQDKSYSYRFYLPACYMSVYASAISGN